MIKESIRIYAGSRKDPITGKRVPNKKGLLLKLETKLNSKENSQKNNAFFVNK